MKRIRPSLVLPLLVLVSVSCGPSSSADSVEPSSLSSSESVGPSSVSSLESSESKSSSKSSSSSSAPKQFSGIVFEDETVVYDGKSHTIVPQNVPSFASYSYTTTKSFTDINEAGYTIKIKVSASGYQSATYSAKLYILPIPFEDLSFEDARCYFDGYEHALTVSNVPSDATVSYRCLNDSSLQNKAIQPGTYRIEATVTAKNHKTTVLTANLEVIMPDFAGVDPSKAQHHFDSSISREELSAMLKEGNYTVDYSSESIRTKRASGEEYAHYYSSKGQYAFTGDRYYSFSKSYASKYGGDEFDYAYLDVAVKDGDYSLAVDGSYGAIKFSKAPSASFEETYGTFGHWIDAYTYSTDENEFAGEAVPGYTTSYHECEVKQDEIVFQVHNYYYHSDDTGVSEPIVNDERTTFVFHNIGNTAINLPDDLIGKAEDADQYEPGSFTYDTIEYYQYDGKYYVNYSLTYMDVAFHEKSTFFLLPAVFGTPVSVLKEDYYKQLDDFEGYTLNVCFDSSGVYQGEYASLGKVTAQSGARINGWSSKYGGTIHYYGEW